MWKLSESASIVNDANNHSESKTKRLPMKTKMASCMCAVAMLFSLSFAPAGQAQSSEAPRTLSDPATVILTNGVKYQPVEIVQIENQKIVLWGPKFDKATAFPFSEIHKIIFLGDEKNKGIVMKNGEQKFGKIISYKDEKWTIQPQGSGTQEIKGKGSEVFLSINFKECCLIGGSLLEVYKIDGDSYEISGGGFLIGSMTDKSAQWNPITIASKVGGIGSAGLGGKWTGYWFAPTTGTYLFKYMPCTGSTSRGGCNTQLTIGDQQVFGGTFGVHGHRRGFRLKTIDLNEGWHPVNIWFAKTAKIGTDNMPIITFVVPGQEGKDQQLTPGSLYHD